MRFAMPLALLLALAAGSSPALAQPLPSGHPPMTAEATPKEDAVVASPSVPAGTIVLKLVDAAGRPVPGADVKLGILFQKIAEGEQRSDKLGKTDAEGLATFSGLSPTSDFSYRLTTRSGPAEYATPPIQLKADMGVQALLHVYPVTRRVEEASIGAIVYVFVETRDDVFQFEVLTRYGNRSSVTWVPDNARMRLPSGFKAFKAGESMGDVRFEEVPGHGAKLVGTFAPGQHQASFRFQVKRQEESRASFDFGLPPHVAEARFLAAAAPGMQIDVDGFEKPRTDVDTQSGQRMLVTRRQAVRGEASGLGGFTAVVTGIPTPGMGRWIAVLIAGGLAALGFAAFRGKLGLETQAELRERDAERAKQVLLDELVDVTRAEREGRIGPSTFETARRVLVDALTRIVSDSPVRPKKARKGPQGKPGNKVASA
jgi:hypothetical protein